MRVDCCYSRLLSELQLLAEIDGLVQQAVHNACDGEHAAHDSAQRRDEVIERLPLLRYHDLQSAKCCSVWQAIHKQQRCELLSATA